MYKLDSGLISIIATIAPIIIGVYSAIDKRQKEKAAKHGNIVYGADDDDKVNDKIFNNPFEELFGIRKDENISAAREDNVEAYKNEDEDDDDDMFSFMREPEKLSVVKKPVVQEVSAVSKAIDNAAADIKYNNGMDSIENAVDFYKGGMTTATAFVEMTDAATDVIEDKAIGSKNENLLKESLSRDMRERLKLNTRDIIFFSEILKPKYQDF
ncbi:MAG: hypothetical protein RR770_02820 [Bacteroidales bacterium]